MNKLKKLAAAAKAAWEAEKAKGDKADAELLVALKEDLDAKEKAVQAEEQKAAGQNDGKTIATVDGSELEAAITKAVGEAINARMTEHAKAQITPEAIKGIVAEAMKAGKLDTTAPDLAAIKGVVDAAIAGLADIVKKAAKPVMSAADAQAKGNDRGQVEIPYRLAKGNLPLHMHQLKNVLLRREMNEGVSESQLAEGAKLADRMFAGLEVGGMKMLNTADSGSGSDWVPRDLSSELQRRLYLESQVAQIMLQSEIQMPTDPFDLPLSTTRPTFKLNNVQGRAAEGTTPGTSKITLTGAKMMALVQYSYETDEDSVIAILPTIQRLLGEAAAYTLETALINGDTTATHMDSDITDANDACVAWKGFRKLALAVAGLKKDMATGGITRSNLIALKKLLKKYGRRPQDMLWIVGPNGENDILGLDDVVTMDKRGVQATTITGVINSFLGIPIAVSEAAREDLNASGVYDGATMTKGSVLLVNKSAFILGRRRDFTVEVEKNIKAQTNDIVASFRRAFTPTETPSATVTSVGIGYNYTA